jgi:hypothetical protein
VATSDDDPNGSPFAENAFAIASNGTNLYVASIGGPQGSSSTPNANTAIQSIPLGFADEDPAAPVLDLSNVGGAYEYRDISFNPNTGMAYIFAGTYNSNWNMDGEIYSTPNIGTTAPTSIVTVRNGAGYYWSAQYTADFDRIWFARGNDVYVYNASNTGNVAFQDINTLSGGGTITYDSLNDLCYIGLDGTRRTLRGYKSHWQRSNSDLARAVRKITKGRPEPTEEEVAQAQASLKGK